MWIRTISEDDATGQVKRYYDATRERRGFVSDTVKIFSIRESHLRAAKSMSNSLMIADSGLTPAEREMLAVRVSHKNGCHY